MIAIRHTYMDLYIIPFKWEKSYYILSQLLFARMLYFFKGPKWAVLGFTSLSHTLDRVPSKWCKS